MRVWYCKIGPATEGTVANGADFPMRTAAEVAFRQVTGHPSSFIFSGWHGTLTESELAVVEKREPSPDAAASYHFHLAMNDRLLQKRIEGRHGWNTCNRQWLEDSLHRAMLEQIHNYNVGKPMDRKLAIDIANYSAFLFARA